MAEAEVVESNVVVVTGEGFNKFVDEKMGVTEPKVEEKTEEVKAEPELEKKDKKVLTGLEKRIHDLTEARRNAEAKAQEEAGKREAAEAKNRELEAKFNPPKTPEGQEPQPSEYTDIAEYRDALKKYTKEQTEKEVRKEYESKAQEQEQATRSARFKEKIDAGKVDIPTYDADMAKSDVKVSNEMRAAIEDSDIPAHLMHYLGTHPEEADRLNKLTVGGMLREVGKLEVKLAKPAPKSDDTKAEISKAPEPISPLKGANSPVGLPVDKDGNWTGTAQEYEAARLAKKI